MPRREDFSQQQWDRLCRAPLVVAMAISVADPGGPIEVLRESAAALRVITETARDGAHGPLAIEVARDAAQRAQHRDNLLAGFRPSGPDARETVIDELRGVEALLMAKAQDEEADGFREYLRVSAQAAALAAREGGFLGLGGIRVSDREQEMLGRLGEIFGTPAD